MWSWHAITAFNVVLNLALAVWAIWRDYQIALIAERAHKFETLAKQVYKLERLADDYLPSAPLPPFSTTKATLIKVICAEKDDPLYAEGTPLVEVYEWIEYDQNYNPTPTGRIWTHQVAPEKSNL